MTRIYLPDTSAAPAITPAVGSGWTVNATGFVRIIGVTVKSSTTLTTHSSAGATAVTPSTMLFRQYIVGPMAAQTISGTVTGVLRTIVSNTALNATVAIGVRQTNSTGTHIADVLTVSYSDLVAFPPLLSTGDLTRRFQDAAEATSLALTSRTLSNGDYLVIEIGYRKDSANTSRVVGLRFGDSAATDFAHTDNLTTDENPWVEFSGTLAFLSAGPSVPTDLAATAASASQIDLSWTASTGGGGVTGYSVERCAGVGCSSFSEVGTPVTTSFSDTGLTADTSYSYRVRANSAGGSSSYSSTATAVTEVAPVVPPPVLLRTLASTITFAGVELTDVISARGQVAADSGWPTCSVFVTVKPETGNEEDDLTVVAGAGTNVTRFVGKVRRFKPSAFPKGIEIVGTGTLAYANEWAPDTDLLFDEEFSSGATDQALVAWALGFVPGISYVGADIQGTGVTLGLEAPEAFDWQAGVSAWQYVQQLDRATLYRTYQQHDGTIRRVQMIGHPSSTTTSFTLADADILEGSTGSRNTEQTRNAAIVRGHDYGDGLGPVLGAGYGSNDFQGDGATAATRHPESFSSDLIEDGNDEDGTPLGLGGIDAQDIADAILNDVNKEFVTADIRSWRDDEHGPGLTCLLDTLERLAIGEKMWVQGYGWEVDDGWSVTYSLSGGGLEQPYTPPEV